MYGNGIYIIDDFVNKYSNELMLIVFLINMFLYSFKIVGVLFFCFLLWWENFVDDKICNIIYLLDVFVKIKFDL